MSESIPKEHPKLVTSSELRVTIPEELATIEALKAALDPEKSTGKRRDMTTALRKGQRTLLIEFRSKDLVALRAGLNTNLRLASSVLKTLDSAKKSRMLLRADSRKD